MPDTKDIKRMYKAVQANLKESLAEVKGVFHITINMLSSDNGYDFLGLVLFHQVVTPGNAIAMKRFVLECLNFDGESHAGVNLARTVYKVLSKFGVEHRTWGAVMDNAKNNETMMKKIASYGLKRLTGPEARGFLSGKTRIANLLEIGKPANLPTGLTQPLGLYGEKATQSGASGRWADVLLRNAIFTLADSHHLQAVSHWFDLWLKLKPQRKSKRNVKIVQQLV
ncbi:hAT family dimerization protein [Ceratobasidium sp. AG-Ba]|nr:hAT family dimerization protein [Ceratobasidium sp. AG-Ba]